MTNATDLRNEFVGKVFHRLTVLEVILVGIKALRLRCVCVCGKEKIVMPRQLLIREVTSCGCWRTQVLGERTRTHGMSNSRVKGYANRTYGIWQAMRDRCSNNNRKDFYRYGGRGISVCERWDSFENFLEDMGEAPIGLTLDRVDNSKGYCKENCEWATRKKQAVNTDFAICVTRNGITDSLRGWSARLGKHHDLTYGRVRRGWTPEEALGFVERAKG